MKFFLMAVFIAAAFLPLRAEGVEKRCEFCHTGHGSTGVLLNNDRDTLCAGCHAERLQQGEHPVGVTPSTAVADLPLYQGKVACITCHDPNRKDAKMLRKPPDLICRSCHIK